MKNAFETVDDLYYREVPAIKVNDLGLPEREILIDLEVKDITAFWYSKQRTLWLILMFCSIFFLFILY
jgi:hypothetical protein